MRFGLAAALLIMLATGREATAQEDDAVSPGPVRYEIEMIVFRNLNYGATGAPAGQPADGSKPDNFAGAGTAAPSEAEFAPLPGESLRLGGIVTRLQRSRIYEPLLHFGWSQVVLREAAARPVPLPADALTKELAGFVTVYRGRYLHVGLDLQLRDRVDPDGVAAVTRSHISQGRRVKPGALNYFDHPGFGVILAVREPAADPAALPGQSR